MISSIHNNELKTYQRADIFVYTIIRGEFGLKLLGDQRLAHLFCKAESAELQQLQ